MNSHRDSRDEISARAKKKWQERAKAAQAKAKESDLEVILGSIDNMDEAAPVPADAASAEPQRSPAERLQDKLQGNRKMIVSTRGRKVELEFALFAIPARN